MSNMNEECATGCTSLKDSETTNHCDIVEDPVINSHTDKEIFNENVCENMKDDALQDETTKTNETSFKLENGKPHLTEEDGWLDILGSGDLKKRVIKSGNGPDTRPTHGNLLTINYKCYKTDSDEPFERNEQFNIIAGDFDLVQGIDLVILLMEEGETAEILIPSRLAYGKQGRDPDIPPNCDLRYEVEVLSIKDISEEPLPSSAAMELGNKKRDRGNFWYGRQEYLNAIQCYKRAIEFLEGVQDGSDCSSDVLQNILDTKIKVHNNMAAAQMKLESYDQALKSLDIVLRIQSKNVKALFRKGKILATKSLTDEAITSLRKAAELEPETKVIQQELSKLIRQKKIEERNQRAMYKRMFPSSPSKPRSAGNWLKRCSVAAGSCLAVLFGIAVYRQYYT